jgi:hypothetical protein
MLPLAPIRTCAPRAPVDELSPKKQLSPKPRVWGQIPFGNAPDKLPGKYRTECGDDAGTMRGRAAMTPDMGRMFM